MSADTSVKLAAEAELVNAYVSDPKRLLFILIEIGDRYAKKRNKKLFLDFLPLP